MRKKWLVIAALLLTFVVASAQTSGDGNIEVLSSGVMYDWNSYAPSAWSRIHDKASGVEIICFRDGRNNFKSPISCVLTGRKW
jgi:hypothetical protein